MGEAREIADQIVELDGKAFLNQHLLRCILVYRGGTPPIMRDSVFTDCSFRFEGEARNTLDFLQGIAAGEGGFPLVLSFLGVHIDGDRPEVAETPDEQ